KLVAYVLHDGRQQNSVWVMQTGTRTQAQVIPPSGAYYTATTFSPDGQFIYYSRGETGIAPMTLYRVPVIGGSPVKVLENVPSAVTFSPDGKRFAFVRGEFDQLDDTSLIVANTDGSAEPRVIARRRSPDYFVVGAGPSWSPDGKTVACGAG